ncbi:HNH endonuclease [Clostridiales bacterium TF09-2AC]|nr:HNH endonuclease [Clostridiales bacterium TF09-2AC]
MDRRGIKWSKEETILAFDLYCKMSFGKISSTNEEIIELATLLERSPGSVALKMHNLAHFDPELQKRNVTAMAHGSKLDKEVWGEFSNDWEELSFQARKILARKKEEAVEGILADAEIQTLPEGKAKDQIVRNRIGQHFFRMAVLNSYDNRCCITGLAIPDLLIASHIKPWKDSDSKTERTNPMNGLSLNALHDKAFDKGLISITTDYRVIISSALKHSLKGNNMEDWLLKFAGKKIKMPSKFAPDKRFLEYHNDVIFQK